MEIVKMDHIHVIILRSINTCSSDGKYHLALMTYFLCHFTARFLPILTCLDTVTIYSQYLILTEIYN